MHRWRSPSADRQTDTPHRERSWIRFLEVLAPIMTQHFRIGIVGSGRIVQDSHLPACLAAENVLVTALVDPVPGRTSALASRFGIDPLHATSAAEMRGNVDGAIIATPNHTHADVAIECLEAGIPILVEKPLAPTVADCEAIRAAALRASLPVAVGYCMRFWPSVQLVRRLISERTFGEPRRFHMQVGSIGGWAPLSAYYGRSDGGGGVMAINGSHYIDRMLDWFGEPIDIAFEDDGKGGPEANAVATFRYEGFEGVIRASKSANLTPGSGIETDHGVLVHRDFRDPVVEFLPRPGAAASFVLTDPECSTRGRPDMFTLQIEDFVDSCRTGRPPTVGVGDGIAATALLESLYARRRPIDEDWYAPVDEALRR